MAMFRTGPRSAIELLPGAYESAYPAVPSYEGAFNSHSVRSA